MRDPLDLSPLRAAIIGEIAFPGSDLYNERLIIDNGRFDKRPAAILLAESSSDVAAAITFARDHHLPITAKAGGHSYAGYCLNDGGIVVDLSRMKAISLNAEARTLTVQLGATWADVNAFLRKNHSPLVPVGGACQDVGVAGFILGGGFSFISRSYGMGCDQLLSLELITPDGKTRHLSADAPDPLDQDLFWACRGGGGGNFGIATEATIQLHQPNSERFMAGTLFFPFERIPAVLEFYNSWAHTLPDALAVYGFVGHIIHPSSHQPVKVLRLQPVFNGPYHEGIELIRPLLDFEPLAADLYSLSLLDYLSLIAKFSSIKGRRAYTRSGILPARAFTPEVVDLLQQSLLSAPSLESFLLWMHQGGQTSRISSDATAYLHRDASYIFETVAIWEDEADTRANIDWAWQVGQKLAPHFTGAFINYIDPLQPHWPEAYYGQNYPRLLDIQSRIDPANLFSFPQAIGSPYSPAPCSAVPPF